MIATPNVGTANRFCPAPPGVALGEEKRRILDSMGGESANRRRFCGPENRLLRDAEEQLKTFAPYGLRT